MAHTKVTKTYSQNTGAANTFSYSGSFDVFKGTEVVALLDNVLLTYTASTINESASPREYTVDTSAKTIHIGGADLSSGVIIIRPETDMGAPTPRADYSPGASITSADLNNNQLQLMRKAMEYDEQKLSSTGGTMTGNLTMGEDTNIVFEGATDDAYETTLTVTDPTADRTITIPNVTGTVVTTGDTGSVATAMIAADAITNAKIADNALDSEHYTDGSIDADHLASSSVTTAKIASDAVTGAKIADDAIDSEHYTDGSIDTAHIGDSQVTTAKIADSNVTTAKIAADAITAAKIADDVVNSEHIAAGAVDLEHMSANSVDSDQYVDGSIDTAHIADLNVTTAKIAADAITGAKIADDAIDSEHLAADSIDAEHYAAGSVDTTALGADAVTGAKIADDTIDSEHYAAGSIDTEHIAGTQVTAAKIASNAVTTAKITDANVTTVKIADSNVTLAKLASDLKSTSISDSDTQLPTSGAVVDYVAAQLLPFGGFEAIATEVAFPNTQPASGVIISISDAAGVVVNGSGTSTTGRTVGSSTVTINNFPSSLNGETLASGVGLMVSSTGSSQIYNYHKILAAETDVKQLSDDINDFQARYRVNSGEPGSNNDAGDLVFDTAASKMKVYDGSSWGEVTSSGDFKYLVMTNQNTTNAATLNGSNVVFDLKETSTGGSAASITSAAQLMVSVNGVVQKPNTGTNPSGLDGFVMSASDEITFCAAPASGDDIFIIQTGSAITPTTPADGTVSAAKIGSGAVTTVKIADDAVTGAKIADDAVGAEHIEQLDADLSFADNAASVFGAGSDLKIYHNTVNYIDSAATQLRIDSDALRLRTDSGEHYLEADANAGVKLNYDNVKKFETRSGGLGVFGHIEAGDDNKVMLGDSNDLQIYHDGQNRIVCTTTAQDLYIAAEEGEIYIQTDFGASNSIACLDNGAVNLYYDNVKKFETTSSGVAVTGILSSSQTSGQGISLGDSVRLDLGSGDDLQIYHDGSNSFIDDAGTGNLVIRASKLSVESTPGTGEKMIEATTNGSVDLYYNNEKRLETLSDGIRSTGKGLFGSSDSSSTNGVGVKIHGQEPEVAYMSTVFNVNSSDNWTYGLYNMHSTNNGYRFYVRVNGGIVNHSGNNVNLCDEREKKDITDAPSQLSKIKNWKLRNFRYKTQPDDEPIKIGVIAQELETVNPELVSEDFIVNKDADGNDILRKGVKEEQMMMISIKALQELIIKVETLETKVAALEAE